MALSWDDFARVDMRVGVVIDAQEFPEARRPAFKLWVDFGPLGIKRSSAQITERYTPRDLIGRLASGNAWASITTPTRMSTRAKSSHDSAIPRIPSRLVKNRQDAQRGPDARQRPKAGREAYSRWASSSRRRGERIRKSRRARASHVERPDEGANEADGPLWASCLAEGGQGGARVVVLED